MTKHPTDLPHVEFLLPTIAAEARVLRWFCGPRPTGWDWGAIIYNRHPELQTLLAGATDPGDIYRKCYRYAKRFHAEHATDFERTRRAQEKEWQSIETGFLTTLSEHFETSYPPRRKRMRAYMSMVPIYPRWLDTWSFNVSFWNPGRVKGIACHEILHFLYFKKWMEVFPNTKPEECNQPHLVWRLSEILDPIILNEHPVFHELVGAPQRTYKTFDAIRIHGVRPFTHFTRLYRRHLKSGAPFADFLRNAWAEARKYEKILMNA